MHRISLLLNALLVLSLLSIAFIPIIVVRYGYGLETDIQSVGAGIVLLIAAGLLWYYRGRAARGAFDAGLQGVLETGALLGLLWAVEIAVNNFLTPPLPARDVVDDLFWALIALGILSLSVLYAYHAHSIARGVQAGVWAGSVSGLIACFAALALIVFGMQFILSDPLSLAEWGSDRLVTSAPTMASYFAFETLAGALSHLVLLGLMMGALLGIAGGLLGKALRALRPLAANIQEG